MEMAPESSTETDIHHNSNDFSTKESEGIVNMQTAPESSTETDIHHDSNDLSTKESEGTVNMQTAPESSTETDIHHDSSDSSTKESEGTVNMQTALESSTETDIPHDSNDLITNESEGAVNMQTAPESSTETDIHHNSNDSSTKESEGTVNMQTAPESSTETDIHNDSNDLSTKESSGEKEVNSGVVNGPTQTKKKTLVKIVDLGPNLDCSESKSESKSKGESGTIIEHKISLQQEIKEPEISKTLVNYTESSDTSDDCPKNVERDLNTDLLNSKDPLISGKLPQDAQPSSDCEEQDDISSQMEKLEGKSAEKKKNEDLFSSDEDNRSTSIVDEIISKLDVNKYEKDQLSVQVNGGLATRQLKTTVVRCYSSLCHCCVRNRQRNTKSSS